MSAEIAQQSTVFPEPKVEEELLQMYNNCSPSPKASEAMDTEERSPMSAEIAQQSTAFPEPKTEVKLLQSSNNMYYTKKAQA